MINQPRHLCCPEFVYICTSDIFLFPFKLKNWATFLASSVHWEHFLSPSFMRSIPSGTAWGSNPFGQGSIDLTGLSLKLAWDFSFLVNIFKWINKSEWSKKHHFKKTDAVGVCTTSCCGFLLLSEAVLAWSWMYYFQYTMDCVVPDLVNWIIQLMVGSSDCMMTHGEILGVY